MSEVQVENGGVNGEIEEALEEPQQKIEVPKPQRRNLIIKAQVQEDQEITKVQEIPEVPEAVEVQEDPAVPEAAEIPKWKLEEVKVTDYMKKSLDFVAKDQGFTDYELIVDHGSNVGDGFVGLIFKATIQEKYSDKALQVVVKVPPANPARRIEFSSMKLFKRECLIYNDILPKLVEFQRENRTRDEAGFFNFPKCYFAEYNEEKDDSIVIMEDLRVSGYQMWSKFNPINFEHAKLVMEHLGHLHAVAFAFKKRHPKEHEEFKKLDDFMAGEADDPRYQYFYNSVMDQAIGTLEEGDTRRRNKMLTLKANIIQVMKEVVQGDPAEPFAIFTHGDCWTNNLMFKYRNKRPEKISFIDWQVSRYSSPVLDLVYFIFNCTDQEMRQKHYDELIHIYHNSLKKLLNHLGGDTVNQFPLTALLRQLKMFGKYGLIMSTILLPMLSTKNEDLPDMDFLAEEFKNVDITKDGDDAMKTLWIKSAGEGTFTKRMRGNIIDTIKFGYL